MALVNGQPVPMKDFTSRYNLALAFPEINNSGNQAELKKSVYNQLIKEEKVSQLARARDIYVSQKQIDAHNGT